jgi:hypothetical protein
MGVMALARLWRGFGAGVTYPCHGVSRSCHGQCHGCVMVMSWCVSWGVMVIRTRLPCSD